MIIDSLQVLEPSGTALTTSRASTNYVALDIGGGDWGVGCNLYIDAMVQTAFTASGSATLVITVQTDDNTSFSSPTTLYTSPSITVASMTAGTKLLNAIKLPRGAEKYLRLNFTVSTGPFTAGTLFAHVTHIEPAHNTAYTSGLNLGYI